MIRMSTEAFERHQARVKGVAARECPEQPKVKRVSLLEEEFARQLAASGLPPMVREHRPIPGRKFRLDFAYPEPMKIAVECEGRVHRIKERWLADLEQTEGWLVLYVCREQIFGGEATKWLKRILEGERLLQR